MPEVVQGLAILFVARRWWLRILTSAAAPSATSTIPRSTRAAASVLLAKTGTARPEPVQPLNSVRQWLGGGSGFERLTLAFARMKTLTRNQRF